jgi:hypothetical protein
MFHSAGHCQDGGCDQSGHQHVMVGVLRTDKEKRAGGQDTQRPNGDALSMPAAQCQIECRTHQPRADERTHSCGEGHHAEDLHRGQIDPIEERRLVEKRQAVESRHHGIALQHFEGHAGVASFVGQQQWSQAQGDRQPQTQDQ